MASEAVNRPTRRKAQDESADAADNVSGAFRKETREGRAKYPTLEEARDRISAHEDADLSTEQVAVLYEKLINERDRMLKGFDTHVQEALQFRENLSDEIDIAQQSTEQAYLFRFADKERKLLMEIDHAIEKMFVGEYGVCEGTEDPVGYKRLEVRPWTRYSVAYKERLEKDRSQHRR